MRIKIVNQFFFPENDFKFIEFITSKITSSNQTIIMHGGGNFGDLYRFITEFRNSIIKVFPNNKIIMLPQTINYRNKTLIKFDNYIYSKADKLTIMTRSLESFYFCHKFFPAVKTILIPDLAFMIGNVKPINKPEVNILVLRRTDFESQFKQVDWQSQLKKKLNNKFSFLVSFNIFIFLTLKNE